MYNVHIKLLRIIQNMYSDVKSLIADRICVPDIFCTFAIAIRQGEDLYPRI